MLVRQSCLRPSSLPYWGQVPAWELYSEGGEGGRETQASLLKMAAPNLGLTTTVVGLGRQAWLGLKSVATATGNSAR